MISILASSQPATSLRKIRPRQTATLATYNVPTYLNCTLMSAGLISLAVDSMTPPKRPPPRRPPRPPPCRAPIMPPGRRIKYIMTPKQTKIHVSQEKASSLSPFHPLHNYVPIITAVGRISMKFFVSHSVLYTTGT